MDTVVILVALAIRTVIGYTQELKAEGMKPHPAPQALSDGDIS